VLVAGGSSGGGGDDDENKVGVIDQADETPNNQPNWTNYLPPPSPSSSSPPLPRHQHQHQHQRAATRCVVRWSASHERAALATARRIRIRNHKQTTPNKQTELGPHPLPPSSTKCLTFPCPTSRYRFSPRRTLTTRRLTAHCRLLNYSHSSVPLASHRPRNVLLP